MIDSKNITILGSGNLATNLALALEKAGHQLIEIYSRNLDHARLLADKHSKCKPTNNLNFSDSIADVFIISVSDTAIPEVVDKIVVPENSLVLHTSGTTNLDVLDVLSTKAHVGIFYPLQTFNKDSIVDFSEIPFLIESNKEKTLAEIESLTRSISNNVQFINSEDRKTIHIAAVFASNFTNRMLKASEAILAEKKIALDILKPLVLQSFENSFSTSPDLALTGPAKRSDLETVNQHLEMLKEKPKLMEIYQLISNQILES